MHSVQGSYAKIVLASRPYLVYDLSMMNEQRNVTMTKTTVLDTVLALFKAETKLTPKQINDSVGRGNYAAKHVLYLKLAGHDIETEKQGRSVVSYTYKDLVPNFDASVKPADRRAKTMLVPKSKTDTAPVPVVTESVEVKSVKATKPVEVKAAKKSKVVVTHADEDDDVPVMDRARKSSKKVDEVEDTFGSSGSVGSYSVDADWDSTDGLDIRHLI
jgi:hypothetical protein